MEEYIEEGDIVITGNRYESQLCAIEMNASCVIVTGDVPISRTITIQAKQHGCAIIATPHATFTAGPTDQSEYSDRFLYEEIGSDHLLPQ